MKNLSPWCVDMELSKVSSETAPWEMELERGGRRVRHKLRVNLEKEGECNAIGCKFQQTKRLKSNNVFFSHKWSSQEQPERKTQGWVRGVQLSAIQVSHGFSRHQRFKITIKIAPFCCAELDFNVSAMQNVKCN